ncbi:MAG: ABC transporter ATP-binding protein [Actinomycetia bacterium]|nr:ABC transporter ATP-binding protein [Actinomycetes bacterium]
MLIDLSALTVFFAGGFTLRVDALSVEGPIVLGVIGPNGSGKTNLIRCLTGLVTPTSVGHLRINDLDVTRASPRRHPAIGLALGPSQLFDDQTCWENLAYTARLYGIRHSRPLIQHWLDAVGLLPHSRKRVRQLSTGLAQRLNIARALLPGANLLVLDEPTAGLDPGAVKDFHQLVLELADMGTSVLMSTHDMRAAQDICDRVLMLRDGTIVADDAPANLLGRFSATVYEFRAADRTQESLVSALLRAGMPTPRLRRDREGWCTLLFEPPPAALDADRTLIVSRRPTTLDDIFPILAAQEALPWGS